MSSFIEPSQDGYTIYSKSGCPYCKKAVKLLEHVDPAPIVVDCDDYLIDDRDGFLGFILERTGKEYKTFPMIFFCGDFIGGFTETKSYFEKSIAFE
jgi:hypothetical protein